MKKIDWKKIVLCIAMSIIAAFIVVLIIKSLGLVGTDPGGSPSDEVIVWSILNW